MVMFERARRPSDPRLAAPKPARRPPLVAPNVNARIPDGLSGARRGSEESAHAAPGDTLPAATWRRSLLEVPLYPRHAVPLQRKSTIDSPGDAHEREADAAADAVLRMAESTPSGAALALSPRASERDAGGALDVGAALRGAERGGEPLPRELRSYFEPRFGFDFGRVRVHADREAAHAARAVQARAYTLGHDIVFGAGAYAPAQVEGRRLVAHELAHVVQQSRGTGRAQRAVVQRKPDPAAETSSGPTPSSLWEVKTPERGNLLLRLVADEPTKLSGGRPNTVGNLASGTVVEVVAKKNDLGWYQVTGEVDIGDGIRQRRTGFVHRRYLFPVSSRGGPVAEAVPTHSTAEGPKAAQATPEDNAAALAEIQALLAHSNQTFQGTEMSVGEAERLVTAITKTQATLSAYGPRLLALRLLGQIVSGGGSVSVTTLAAWIRDYKSITVMRPDGYLARVIDGAALQRFGDVEFNDGRLTAGYLDVGAFYYSDQGVLYQMDEMLQRTGSPVGELGLDHDLPNKVLDGVADAGVAMASGLYKLLRHPIQSIEDLKHLPSAVVFLIMSAPIYWDRFKAMPLGDQVREVSRIVTTLVTLYGSAAGTTTRLSAATADIGSISIKALTLGENGTLAVSTVSVPVGAMATAMSGGPGGVFILHMANQSGSGGGSKPLSPEAAKEPPGKQPAPRPSAGPLKPSRISVDQAIRAGNVKPGGLLERILRGIEAEFAKAAPKTADGAADLATRVTDRLSTREKPVRLGNLVKWVPEEGGYQLWRNNGGVTTRYYSSGMIMVLKDEIPIFCLIP
ncbi:DUF4157 domain-containing protein [Polyangium fumosum]|uniref:DUF4157 domain-containing protein n=1 Tax=Polyangium fumosum TaxID=889272 RepID=A0A4U1J649_9BACT|nr:DUF4157 domain-containing protein [Polyangium fumosum]TKD02731.1 DUF4157 domain-containing protein [Polyangium fumosum]